MKRLRISIIFILVIMQLVGALSFPVLANNKKRETVKVACYPLEGFFEYDENGKVSGYGVEVLDKIEQYMDVHFEYIKAPSWSEGRQMVLDGRADIRMPVTVSSSGKYMEKFSITNISIMESYHVLMTLEERDDLVYEDTEKFARIKVGISKDLYESMDFSKYLKKLNVAKKNLVIFKEQTLCEEALERGRIDAIITNVMDAKDNNKVLSRFGYTANYIAAKKGSELTDRIDETLGRIRLAEPSFFSTTYSAYYPERVKIPLTKEERDYISRLDKLTFAYKEEQGFFCRSKAGEKGKGIYPEVARALCKRLGVKYEEKVIDSTITDRFIKDEENAKANPFSLPELQGVDVLADVYYDAEWHRDMQVEATSYYFEQDYYLITRKGEKVKTGRDKIAVVKDSKVSYALIELLSTENVIWCDSYDECFELIRTDKADFSVINTMIAEYYMGYYKNASLTTALVDFVTKSCMATESDILSSILSKVLLEMDDYEIQDIINKEAKEEAPDNGLIGKLYEDPEQSINIIVTVALSGVIIIVLLIAVHQQERKNEVLEKTSAARMDFMSRMSHDIRTPMNAVLGMTHLAQEEDNPEQVKEYLNKIEGSGQYLLALLNDMLDMSRMESGEITLHEEAVPIRTVEKGIVEMFSVSAKERGVELITNFLGEKEVWVYFDVMRTQQIYANLLSNAIKFTGEGKKVYWDIHSSKIGNNKIKVTSVIRDEGCGMSKEFMERLFIPFEREENPYSNESAGTGLGLAIVKKLVDRMDGTIEVESSIGVGTTITTSFIREMAKAQDVKQVEKCKEAGTSIAGSKVLVVEDQDLNREIISKLLESRGVEVRIATNGQEAVDLFSNMEDDEIDMILMDIRMPVLDGIEATKKIREIEGEKEKKIPIIALTANAFEEDREQTREAGMNAHLAKPINSKELFHTMEDFLNKKVIE